MFMIVHKINVKYIIEYKFIVENKMMVLPYNSLRLMNIIIGFQRGIMKDATTDDAFNTSMILSLNAPVLSTLAATVSQKQMLN